MPKKRMGRKAWLITWEWTGASAAIPEDEVIAAILHPLTNPKLVKRMMELLYAAREYKPIDKLSALSSNPYPAEYNLVNVEHELKDGEIWHQRVPQQGQIYCGHNPRLYARCVDDLRLKDTSDPDAGLIWKERDYQSTIRYKFDD